MRRHEQGFSHILLLILFVAVLAAIGFAGWRVYQLQRPIASDSTTAAEAENAPCTSAQPAHISVATYSLVKKLCNEIAQKYTVDSGQFDDTVITQANHIKLKYDTANNDGPVWQLPGDAFSIYNNGTIYALRLEVKIDFKDDANFSGAKALSAALIQALENQGLHKDMTPYIPTPNDEVYYTSSQTVCSTSDLSLSADVGGLGISCADLSAYLPVAVAVRPLMDAYFQKYPEKKNHTLEMAIVRTSKTAGYRYTDGPIAYGYPRVWAYEKNGQWYFIETDENGLHCDMSEYSPDVRLAFLGEVCNGSGEPGSDTIQ